MSESHHALPFGLALPVNLLSSIYAISDSNAIIQSISPALASLLGSDVSHFLSKPHCLFDLLIPDDDDSISLCSPAFATRSLLAQQWAALRQKEAYLSAERPYLPFPPERFMVPSPLPLHHHDDNNGCGANIRAVLPSEDGHPLPSRPYFTWELNIFFDMTKRAPAFIVIGRDVTQEHCEMEALRRAKEKAETEDQSKSSFLASMSHEIRTPLNGIKGMAALLADTALTAEQSECVQNIQVSGDHLLRVINGILDLSKIGAGKMELEHRPVCIETAIEESLELSYRPAKDHHIEVVYYVESIVPRLIYGDVTRIRQIICNLLGNALKFTSQGEVVVHVSLLPPSSTTSSFVGSLISTPTPGSGSGSDATPVAVSPVSTPSLSPLTSPHKLPFATLPSEEFSMSSSSYPSSTTAAPSSHILASPPSSSPPSSSPSSAPAVLTGPLPCSASCSSLCHPPSVVAKTAEELAAATASSASSAAGATASSASSAAGASSASSSPSTSSALTSASSHSSLASTSSSVPSSPSPSPSLFSTLSSISSLSPSFNTSTFSNSPPSPSSLSPSSSSAPSPIAAPIHPSASLSSLQLSPRLDKRATILFSVRDTGCGIPVEAHKKLFHAFSQVDASTQRTHGGTGLGLVISMRLCELMGGRMWLESEVGVGSTFFFTINAETVDEDELDARDKERLGQSQSSPGKRYKSTAHVTEVPKRERKVEDDSKTTSPKFEPKPLAPRESPPPLNCIPPPVPASFQLPPVSLSPPLSTLPSSTASSPSSSAPPSAATSPSSTTSTGGCHPTTSLVHLQGANVLLVDDSTTALKCTAGMLKRWGLNPISTTSPTEALQWVRDGSPFDLAIIDSDLNDAMSGFELGQRIRDELISQHRRQQHHSASTSPVMSPSTGPSPKSTTSNTSSTSSLSSTSSAASTLSSELSAALNRKANHRALKLFPMVLMMAPSGVGGDPPSEFIVRSKSNSGRESMHGRPPHSEHRGRSRGRSRERDREGWFSGEEETNSGGNSTSNGISPRFRQPGQAKHATVFQASTRKPIRYPRLLSILQGLSDKPHLMISPLTPLPRTLSQLDSKLGLRFPLSIAVVEDNHISMRLACSVLSRLGFKDVVCCNDGLEAVQAG